MRRFRDLLPVAVIVFAVLYMTWQAGRWYGQNERVPTALSVPTPDYDPVRMFVIEGDSVWSTRHELRRQGRLP